MDSAVSVGSRVRRSTDHGWLEQVGRLGLLARGLLHGIVAWLAIEVAHGDGHRRADSQGALAVIAHQPLGRGLLVAVAAGFVAYAVWSFAAVTRTDGSELAEIGRGVVYLALAILAGSVALGSGRSGGSGSGGGGGRESDLTAQVLRWPGGRVLVVAIAIGVIVAGAANAWKIGGRRWADGLELDRHSQVVQRLLGVVATVGLAARSVVFGLVGIFIARAAVRYDPKEAEGLDGALKRLAAQPHGPALLTVVALGLVAYGLWCVAMAAVRPTGEA
jgi:hypothetical protein